MKPVRKAIIAAARLGSRMYPYTKVESKLMIPVLNKPVIQYLLEEMAAAGITEVVIVANHISKIKQLVEENPELTALLKKLKKEKLIKKLHHVEYLCKVDLIEQDEPRGWMHEVLHSKKFIKNEPFLVSFSDVLYKSKTPAALQVIKKFNQTGKNIRAESRFVFKPDIFKKLENKKFVLGEDIVDLDIFDQLRQEEDLFNFNVNGEFYNVGDSLSHLKTETAFGLQKFGKEYMDFLKTIVK